jgi:hypothetical protein
MIKNHEIAMVVNTVEEKRSAIADSRAIRTSALQSRVVTYTTIAGCTSTPFPRVRTTASASCASSPM